MSMIPDFEGGNVRRLPVYLLLDCSTSMQGHPIVAVNEGLNMIYRLLRNDLRAQDTVYISLIRFASQAEQDPLTPLLQFQPPILQANGNTALGAALQLLVQSIREDLVVNTMQRHGDYRPLVFLLTDGEPNDHYKDAVYQLHQLHGNQRPTIVALGCGNNVKVSTLREITTPENIFLMQNVTGESIQKFFQWMSGSIIQTANAGGSFEPTVYAGPDGTVRASDRPQYY
ncbi:MAG TPA: VWA domain-containing protein [Ktedonobacteraceae bacterium]|nr:VWA domain-containing protein [Ktedonobacteraceae bacterium]